MRTSFATAAFRETGYVAKTGVLLPYYLSPAYHAKTQRGEREAIHGALPRLRGRQRSAPAFYMRTTSSADRKWVGVMMDLVDTALTGQG
jgi:hypothetical protein